MVDGHRASILTNYRTIALNFSVTDRLGGTQRNPPFSTDPTSEFFVQPDRENLFNFQLDELGIVDLPLVPVQPNIGMRFVPWIWIDHPPIMGAPATITLVDAVTLKQMRLVALIPPGPGTDRTYFDRSVEVPQGAALRFSGFEGAQGEIIRLRLEVVPAFDNLQWARQKLAFCCFEERAGPQGPLRQQNVA